jgi:long-chain fatty acid transport protein
MKAKGMGGAAAASTDNAFAGANNPATAVFAGNRMEAGVDLFMPDRGMSRSGDTGGAAPGSNVSINSDSKHFLIPEFGYIKKFDDKTSYGVTVYGNGGMNTDYASSPILSPTNAKMGVDLMQLIVAPTASFKLDANSSVGVSPLLVYQTFKADGISHFAGMSNNSNSLSNNGKDSSTGIGVRLGYFSKLNSTLSVGASYSPKIKMSSMDKYSGLFAGNFDIPENYVLGLNLAVTPTLNLALDYQRINYGDVKAIGNPTSNLVTCANGGGAAGSASASCLGGASGPGFGWSNINVIKLGAEWRYSKQLMLRAGYNHSDNPVSSQDVTFNIMAPGIMTKHYTLGATYEVSPANEVTLAYMYAPTSTVSGSSLMNQLQTQNGPMTTGASETIRMKQQSLGVQYAWKF